MRWGTLILFQICQILQAAIRRGLTALDCVKMNMSDYILVGVVTTIANFLFLSSGT